MPQKALDRGSERDRLFCQSKKSRLRRLRLLLSNLRRSVPVLSAPWNKYPPQIYEPRYDNGSRTFRGNIFENTYSLWYKYSVDYFRHLVKCEKHPNPYKGGKLMQYLLYLKESLKRRPKLHLTLYIILTCAFILPLLISIYRDSNAYGTKQYLLNETQGETFHISNASESDCAYFENMDGLSAPYFSDGTIFLRILSDAQWKDHRAVSDYGNQIMKRIGAAGAEYLLVRVFDYDSAHGISNDAADISGQQILLFMNIMIILLSVFIIQSAYRSHLQHFSSDIGTLYSCGADRRQIHSIFICEFVIIFILAAVSAVLISIGTMKLLFSSYLEIKGVPGLAWLIFHIDPLNTILHLMIFFVTLCIALIYTLKKNDKKSTWTMLHDINGTKQIKDRERSISIKANPDASLASLWKQRLNHVYRSCLLITIPVMIIFLFLFNYLSLNMKSIDTPPQYELQLTKDVNLFGGFTEEEIEYVDSINEIAHIDCFRTIPRDLYMLETENPEEPILPTNILPYQTDEPSAMQLNEYDVVVSDNLIEEGYKIGDKITLLTFSDDTDESIVLSVVGMVPDNMDDHVVDLYLSDKLYSTIIDATPIDRIEIKLSNPAMHQQIELNLREHFLGAEYEITNRQMKIDFMHETSTGIYLLLAFLFGILFLFILVILYVKLCDYIRNNQKTIRTLYTIGASKRMLHGSYIRQASTAAVFAATIPAIVCIPLIVLVSIAVNTEVAINVPVLLAYIGASVLVAIIYLAPIHGTLRKIFREF